MADDAVAASAVAPRHVQHSALAVRGCGGGVGEVGDDGRQVSPLDVVGIAGKIFGTELPVAGDDPALRGPENLDTALAAVEEEVEVPGHLAEVFQQRGGVGVEGAEVEALVVVDLGYGSEAPLAGVQLVVVGLFQAGDGDELAVGTVGPAVVGADERGGVAGIGTADAIAAVAADVEEGADRAVGVAHHEDRVLAHVGGEVVPGIGDLGLVAEEQPAAGKDLLQFLLVDVGLDEDFLVEHPPVGIHQTLYVRRH